MEDWFPTVEVEAVGLKADKSMLEQTNYGRLVLQEVYATNSEALFDDADYTVIDLDTGKEFVSMTWDEACILGESEARWRNRYAMRNVITWSKRSVMSGFHPNWTLVRAEIESYTLKFECYDARDHLYVIFETSLPDGWLFLTFYNSWRDDKYKSYGKHVFEIYHERGYTDLRFKDEPDGGWGKRDCLRVVHQDKFANMLHMLRLWKKITGKKKCLEEKRRSSA